LPHSPPPIVEKVEGRRVQQIDVVTKQVVSAGPGDARSNGVVYGIRSDEQLAPESASIPSYIKILDDTYR